MKKKFISLVLAILIPFSSYNGNYCSAYKNFTSRKYLDQTDFDRRTRNNSNLDEINAEEIQMLKDQIRKLEKERFKNVNKKPSFWRSTWNSAKSIFKEIFSVGLGATVGAVALIGVAALVSGLAFLGKAIYDCATDNKCHFTDESFFKKFNRKNFEQMFSSLKDLVQYIFDRINFVIVRTSENDEEFY